MPAAGEASASHARNVGAAAAQERLDPVPRLRRDRARRPARQLLRRADRRARRRGHRGHRRHPRHAHAGRPLRHRAQLPRPALARQQPRAGRAPRAPTCWCAAPPSNRSAATPRGSGPARTPTSPGACRTPAGRSSSTSTPSSSTPTARRLRELGRQWRGYAAGARWLSERYPDFKPDPGLNRGVRLLLKRVGIGPGVAFRADGRSSRVLRAARPAGRSPAVPVRADLPRRSRSRSGCACPTQVKPRARQAGGRDARRSRRSAGLLAALRPRAGRGAARRRGATVRLVTSRFAYGEPPAARRLRSVRSSSTATPSGPRARALRALSKRAEHPPDMLPLPARGARTPTSSTSSG